MNSVFDVFIRLTYFLHSSDVKNWYLFRLINCDENNDGGTAILSVKVCVFGSFFWFLYLFFQIQPFFFFLKLKNWSNKKKSYFFFYEIKLVKSLKAKKKRGDERTAFSRGNKRTKKKKKGVGIKYIWSRIGAVLKFFKTVSVPHFFFLWFLKDLYNVKKKDKKQKAKKKRVGRGENDCNLLFLLKVYRWYVFLLYKCDFQFFFLFPLINGKYIKEVMLFFSFVCHFLADY